MLLENYTLEIFNSKCQPGAMGVHCFADLKQDVGKALPYLNSVLGGYEYIKDPPSVTFKIHGKLLTVYGRKIAVNANRDEAEARKIIEWMKGEINDAWDNRETIIPRYEGMPRPQVIQVLKTLPKTNCRECGEPTCMVFATRVVEGAKGSADCPSMTMDARKSLDDYMAGFSVGSDGIPW